MIEVKYINSNNQSISFFTDKLKISDGIFHKRKWTINDGSIKKDAITYSITLTLRGSVEERKKKLNELYDCFEVDLIKGMTGKLYYGDYYINCFISSSSVQPNSILNCRTDDVLEIHCPIQSWIKENIFSFFADDSEILADEGTKKYSYTYPYKYKKNIGSSNLNNDSICSSNFKLMIYGPVSNPSIMIGGNIYGVDVNLNVSEYLTIDSYSREIYITDINGEIVNAFDFRNKEHYIFEKINIGLNNVDWSGGFGFDVIVYDERSEPKWI